MGGWRNIPARNAGADGEGQRGVDQKPPQRPLSELSRVLTKSL